MKIGIDARLIHETGVGRYIKNLLVNIAELDNYNTYKIYLLEGKENPLGIYPENFSFQFVQPKWHTIEEQVILPIIYQKDELDVLHVPYFTVPLFYPGKIVSTVHDLTILRFSTGKASTLPYPLYAVKKLGYNVVIEHGIHKSRHILAVSETTKKDVVDTFHIRDEKITVTYEGVDSALMAKSTTSETPLYTFPYLLYVGNAYPHKNIQILLDVLRHAHRSGMNKLKLVCVGKQDYFYTTFKQAISEQSMTEHVILRGFVDDLTLASLYRNAIATVTPTIAEGFALPPLEALACDCPVLVHDLPIFHEILGNKASYVRVNNIDEWVSAIQGIRKNRKYPVWKDTQEKRDFFQHYSWKKMAKQTIQIYSTVGTS